MTYTVETSTWRLDKLGKPQRPSPSTVRTSAQERQLITIEFAPKIHPNETDYSYPQPQFVFGEKVTRITGTSPAPLTICGMELVESKTNSGQLLNQPYWKYLVNDGQQKTWFSESALTLLSTCSQCPHFNDYEEANGRGWCRLFDTTAKTHHQRTNDCDLFAHEDPLDTPHPRFALDSKVKVIDATEHHNEWATFTVIGRQYNHERSALEYEASYSKRDLLYRSTEAYLSEAAWYYWLINPSYESTYGERLWVAENEICLFDESHLISTEDVF
jgi:hypothetical protein